MLHAFGESRLFLQKQVDVMAKLNAASGLANLHQKRFKQAARKFTEVKIDMSLPHGPRLHLLASGLCLIPVLIIIPSHLPCLFWLAAICCKDRLPGSR